MLPLVNIPEAPECKALWSKDHSLPEENCTAKDTIFTYGHEKPRAPL